MSFSVQPYSVRIASVRVYPGGATTGQLDGPQATNSPIRRRRNWGGIRGMNALVNHLCFPSGPAPKPHSPGEFRCFASYSEFWLGEQARKSLRLSLPTLTLRYSGQARQETTFLLNTKFPLPNTSYDPAWDAEYNTICRDVTHCRTVGTDLGSSSHAGLGSDRGMGTHVDVVLQHSEAVDRGIRGQQTILSQLCVMSYRRIII